VAFQQRQVPKSQSGHFAQIDFLWGGSDKAEDPNFVPGRTTDTTDTAVSVEDGCTTPRRLNSSGGSPFLILTRLFPCFCGGAGKIKGQILGPTSAPVADARMSVLNANGATVAKTASHSQGNFKFASVDAESYCVAAEISSFGAASSAITSGARYVHSSLDSSPAVWLRSSVQLSGSDEEVRCSL
jgi:hypothetical protein